MALCSKLVSHGTNVVYLLNCCATIVVMCGLASLTSLCHTHGVVASNDRKLLLSYAAPTSSCAAVYRFEWWGWALQVAFLCLLGIHWAAKCKTAGVMVIGSTSTVLSMLFANEQRIVYDDLAGKALSRSILLFVGWLLVATFNYLLFIVAGCQETSSGNTSCAAPAATTTTTAAAAKGKKPAAETVQISTGSGTAGTAETV